MEKKFNELKKLMEELRIFKEENKEILETIKDLETRIKEITLDIQNEVPEGTTVEDGEYTFKTVIKEEKKFKIKDEFFDFVAKEPTSLKDIQQFLTLDKPATFEKKIKALYVDEFDELFENVGKKSVKLEVKTQEKKAE